MRRAASWPLTLTLAVSAGGASVAAHADESERPDAPPKKSCVAVATSAPYVNYGYDHVVTLAAGCEKPQRCTVKTDVAPTPVTVERAATESKSVVTFRGSPSSEFKADVSCKPAG
jgi:hypothetical protein